MKLIRRATLCALILGLPRPAPAQTTEPKPTYTVDAAQGPVTGSTRVIGLGGAFVSIAEGMDGVAVNPASVAVRSPYSWNRLDYGFGISFAIGAWLPKTNFLNQNSSNQNQNGQGGSVNQRSLLFGSLGLTINYEYAGFGISAEGQRQALQRPGDSQAGLNLSSLSGNFGIIHSSLAYGFGEGQVVIGGGTRVTGVSLSSSSGGSGLLNVAGVGYQVGAIIKPIGKQFRIGVEYKSSVEPALSSSGSPQSVYQTSALRLPWQVSGGFAYQFGPRPLNPRFFAAEDQTVSLNARLEADALARRDDLDRAKDAYRLNATLANKRALQRIEDRNKQADKADQHLLEQAEKKAEKALRNDYLARPRPYFLVSTELLAIGSSPESVSFGSYYQGNSTLQFSGQHVTWSPRLGLETEAVPNWLKLRAGTYLEPARVNGVSDRWHGTFGFDAKLFSWNVFGLIGDFDSWTISAAIDGARQYLSTAFSIGFWH